MLVEATFIGVTDQGWLIVSVMSDDWMGNIEAPSVDEFEVSLADRLGTPLEDLIIYYHGRVDGDR